MGNRRVAPAPDAVAFRKYRQSPVHFANFVVRQTMDARIALRGRSCLDGVGSRLPQSSCSRAPCCPNSHRFGVLAGHISIDVCARHGPQPARPRRKNHSAVHLPEAGPGSLWPDRVQLDQRCVVLYDQRSAKHPSLLRLPQPGGDAPAGHQCRIGADERDAARRYRTAGGSGRRTEAPRRVPSSLRRR